MDDPNATVAIKYACAERHAEQIREALDGLRWAGVRFNDSPGPKTLLSWLFGRDVAFSIRCPAFFGYQVRDAIGAVEREQAAHDAF